MWWTKKDPIHLPRSTGPYGSGAVDVHLGYSKDGILFRMYYPCPKEENSKRWYPFIASEEYLKGIANVVMLYNFILKALMWKAGKPLIPVSYGEKLLNPNGKKFKCIVMSHGLGACKSFYNLILMELASRGYIVLSIEHREESACYTYYYKSKEDALNGIKTPILFRKISLGKNHLEERNKQVNYRSEECIKAFEFLKNLNAGVIPEDVFIEPFQDLQIDFKLEDLIGNIDTDNLMAMGQSFGGATALLTLGKLPELKCGILLDPWMFSVKNEGLVEKIKQPMVFINTQTFHVVANSKALEPYNKELNSMQTILHTTHEFQTDTVVIIGSWLNAFMTKLNPMKALKINNYLILNFLSKITGHESHEEQYDEYLHEQAKNIAVGVPTPWA